MIELISMEIKKEVLPKSKVKLLVKISSPEMRTFFARTYNKLAPTVEVKGFRKGMAPKTLIISAIGESKIQSEIIDLALRDTYIEALKKENLMPVAMPKINIKMVKDLMVDTAELEYEAEIDLLPEVKIGNYKKIKVNPPAGEKEIKVTDDELEQVLSHLARQKASFNEIDRPLKMGDRAEINFEGFERKVKLENLSSQNYPLILGSKVLIPEFEEKLIGLKKGDIKEFQIELKPATTVPGTEAGSNKKEIDFKVEVLQTQEVILPKLDDDFSKNFQKKSLEELRSAIKEDILKQKIKQEKNRVESEIIEKLLAMTEVEVSEGLIDQEIERIITDLRSKTSMSGMTFEKYLESIKKTLDELKKDLRPQAEKNIKIGLALGEVVKQESANWRIDPKDKEAGLKALEKLIGYATK